MVTRFDGDQFCQWLVLSMASLAIKRKTQSSQELACHSIRHAQPIWAWMICYHAHVVVIPPSQKVAKGPGAHWDNYL